MVTLQAQHISNRSITAVCGASTTPAEIHVERGIEMDPETESEWDKMMQKNRGQERVEQPCGYEQPAASLRAVEKREAELSKLQL